jgi:hypothetical protein
MTSYRDPGRAGARHAGSGRALLLPPVLCLALGSGACVKDPLAPRNGAIEVHVSGTPADPGIEVTVFLHDRVKPFNRVSMRVAMGGSHRFENLGAGFEIDVGVEGLAEHGCTVVNRTSPAATGSQGPTIITVETQSGIPSTVRFELTCRSATLELQVAGLPAGDSAAVILATGDSMSVFNADSPIGDTLLVRNGAHRLARLPHGSVWVVPQRVTGADGVGYEAAARHVALRSRETAAATVAYARVAPTPPPPPVGRTADVVIEATGVPVDTGIAFTAFVRDAGGATRRDSAVVALGRAVRFADVGAGRMVDVGLEGIDAHACTVQSATRTHAVAGGRASVALTTQPGITDSVTFRLRCRSGTIELAVSGLPAGDSARVALRGLADTVVVWVRNGTARVPTLPSPLVEIEADRVAGADGRVYLSTARTVAVASREVTATTLVFQTAPTTTCPWSQPIAWYRMGGAADSSGNGHHGTLQGPAPAPDRHGTPGGALAFDGADDRIDLGNRFDALAVPFSVAAWVHHPAAARGEFRSILATDDAPGTYAGLFFQLTPAGQPQISYADGGPVGGQHRRTLQATAPIATDAWVHLVATVRGPTDMTLYVNGVPVPGTFDGTGGPMAHTAAPARIGSFSLVAANRPWLGRLDELRVYGCSLDAAEVTALHARP